MDLSCIYLAVTEKNHVEALKQTKISVKKLWIQNSRFVVDL